MATMRNFDYTG